MVTATVKLYGDIGLDPTFKKTIDFESKNEQQSWFNSQPYTSVTAQYNKLHNTFAINKDYGTCLEYTYVAISNLDSSGRIYYGFISNVTAVDEQITRFSIVIDPIQTFMCEWELGMCEVTRSHRPRYESNGKYRIQYAKEGFDGERIILNSTDVESTLPSAVIVAFTKDYKVYKKEKYYTQAETGTDYYTTISALKYGIVPISSDITNVYNVAINFGQGDLSGNHYLPSFSFGQMTDGSWIEALQLNPEAVVGAWVINNLNAYLNSYVTSLSTSYYFSTYSYSRMPGYYCTADKTFWGGDFNPLFRTADDIDLVIGQHSGSISLDESNYGNNAMQLLHTSQILDLFERPFPLKGYTDTLGSTIPTSELSPENEPQLKQQPIQIMYFTHSLGDTILEVPDVVRYSGTDTANVYHIPYIRTMLKTTGVTQYISFNNTDTEQFQIKNLGEYEVPAVDVLSDPWLSYCLTQRTSDRAMSVINGISAVTNGATRTMSTKDLTPVGAVAGVTSAATQIAGQMAKEQVMRNEPANTLIKGDGMSLYLKPFKIVVVGINEEEKYRLFEEYTKFGNIYHIAEVPDIHSRKFFNYIETNSCIINGALPANLKSQVASLINNGITFFHYPNSTSTEYPNEDNSPIDSEVS